MGRSTIPKKYGFRCDPCGNYDENTSGGLPDKWQEIDYVVKNVTQESRINYLFCPKCAQKLKQAIETITIEGRASKVNQ